MDRKQVMEMFNKQPRIGTLSTCDNTGNVNVAVFGSPMMVDENTVIMGIGLNRSLKNLKENPKAVFIVMEPGETAPEWKGARVYLKAITIDDTGPFFDEVVEGVVKVAGEGARQMLKAAVRFEIKEIRPIMASNA